MPLFPRFLHPIPATRRFYSSFFSSKPGGGRYFNSAKPSKSVVASHGVKKGKGEPNCPSHSADTPDGQGANVSHGNSGQKIYKQDESSLSSPQGHSPPSSATSPLTSSINKESSSTTASSPPPVTSSQAVMQLPTLPLHPTLNPQDYKLHQFFSLHRPLLLLSQPPSVIFESTPPSKSLILSSSTEASRTGHVPPPPVNVDTLDDPPEASPESDADAARQLGRALVMNRIGATVSWEAALRRLGLDVELEAGRAGLKQEMEREWVEVMLDSTRRKRRKKMKKHKLKKRRRATRSQRLKIGR